MTRDAVFSLIRGHLADELELDPSTIEESTRFREDLGADSLDLYTLVQELEDSYGVKVSDEEAARILTVRQAVDFVLNSGVATNGTADGSLASSSQTAPSQGADAE
jgi:acyl carrier protein